MKKIFKPFGFMITDLIDMRISLFVGHSLALEVALPASFRIVIRDRWTDARQPSMSSQVSLNMPDA